MIEDAKVVPADSLTPENGAWDADDEDEDMPANIPLPVRLYQECPATFI